jgi:hypothetical protein
MNLPKEWYNDLLTVLKEFSDKDYQIKIWLKGEGNEMSSFVEATCKLFDDSALSYYLDNTNEIIISNDFMDILGKISFLIDTIEKNIAIREIIEHKNMSKIRLLAKNAIILIENFLTNLNNTKPSR